MLMGVIIGVWYGRELERLASLRFPAWSISSWLKCLASWQLLHAKKNPWSCTSNRLSRHPADQILAGFVGHFLRPGFGGVWDSHQLGLRRVF